MKSQENPGRILIVDDDPKMADLITHYLKKESFQSFWAKDGPSAIRLTKERSPSLVILDIMLPGLDGWEVCREIRKFSTIPIIMLSARNETIDTVMGLSLGADDYLAKPFSSHELIARIKAVLRRVGQSNLIATKVLRCGKLVVDLDKRLVKLDQEIIDLTPHEYCLLTSLMSYPGKVFSRDELLNRIYPNYEVSVISKVIDIHIGKLRRKIEKDHRKPRMILAVRGVGYRFAESQEEI
jgi:DNA-binding response OmpR family regulator